MRFRIAVLALAVTIHVQAAPAGAASSWTVVEGQTLLSLDAEGLREAGLFLGVSDASGGSSEIMPTVVLNIDAASSLRLSETRGILERLDGGGILHRETVVFQYEGVQVVIPMFQLRPAGAGLDSGLVVTDAADPEDAVLLDLHVVKLGFDRVAERLLIEGGELSISPALAKRLGDDKLAGLVVGGLTAQTTLAWAGGDEPGGVGTGPSGGGLRGGNGGTVCPTPGGPDVIVGDLLDVSNYASVGGIEAFAVGTTSCNIGDQNLLWIANTPDHPVIGQTMFRLNGGRFEQIGQSWLKHGFTALTQNICGCGCNGQGGAVLGVGCSDPYCCGLNGSQSGLGPKSEVNAFTGEFLYPWVNRGNQGETGNSIYKRVQVQISDLDPAQNGGGQYFVEGQYVTPDDAAAGNQNNNASYRAINVSGGGSAWSISLTGTTQREQPAIRAWQDTDPTVTETDVIVPGEGLIIVSAQATDLGSGVWHYEYAVQNVTSDRSVGSFAVPVDSTATVQNIGFHDVDYHSGEPFDGTDWVGVFSGGSVSWSTDTFAANKDANALRWGTLYNFRFDADVAPVTSAVTLGLFKPGLPASVQAVTVGPASGAQDCQPNGVPDNVDIANGTSRDCNNNLIPDECETFQVCPLTATQVATGLTRPVFVTAPTNDPDRLFIVEQPGRIRILSGGVVLATPFLDIDALVGGGTAGGDERGLLSMAFHPNYAANGFFYVNYTNNSGNTVIARYTVSANPDVADSGSALILKTITQPFSNHNGGQLQFGPDGFLYVGMGDGGAADDPSNNAQNLASLLGKMLRLDVDAGSPYIAPGNPFGDEIWAYGLRNPWRFSFDALTGDMYIGDVGQDAREEIDFQPAGSAGGENYGWDCEEGLICTPTNSGGYGCVCGDPALVDPILDISHADSGTCSITGGYVYRGCAIPWLSGTYFYADFCGDYVRTFRFDGATITEATDRTAELQPAVGSLTGIVSFGEDAFGELYIVTLGGSIFKIECAASGSGCGNGIIDPGEQCDPPGPTCSCDCQDILCTNVLLDDNFEVDLGWTTTSIDVSTGFWQRGIPVDDPGWGFDPASDSDGSGQCYLTQNEIGNTDVDVLPPATNGIVELLSPTLDMSLGEVTISYDYYLNLTNADGSDMLLVEISDNDGVGPWIELARHTTNNGLNWTSVVLTPCDLAAAGVNYTSTMKIRFRVNDGGSQSIVEGGIDAVKVVSNGCPPTGGDAIRGGLLYDKWWIVNGAPAPVGDHPLYPPAGQQTGSDTHRCKECHGWDYKGAAGAYASGPHFTGIPGVFGSVMTEQQMFDIIKFDSGTVTNGHGFGGAGGLSDTDINDLVAFLQTRVIDTDLYIDGSAVFLGDDVQGGIDYTTGGAIPCITCHGAFGRQIDFDPTSGVEFVGTIAVANPWELLHKIRVGNPSAPAMPSWLAGGGTDQGAADIGRYAQLNLCVDVADGNMDGIGGTDGADIQLFVDAIMGASTAPADVCPGDFSSNDAVDVGDITGMVNTLLAP